MTTTRATLVPHPSTPCDAVRSLGAHVTLTASGRLHLHFVLLAQLAQLAIPAPAPQRFRDGLWRHTCFEAFVSADGGAPYRELNVSPSREWAAYSFAKYRESMTKLEHPPRIDVRRDLERLDLEIGLELAGWFDTPWRTLHVGLSAVIETADGERAYFALRHPAEKPDFHHRGSFVLQLS